MPMAGILRGSKGKDIVIPSKPSLYDAPESIRGRDPKITTRFARSSKFQNDAIRLYANIPFDVWLAPIFSEDAYVLNQFINPEGGDRIKVIDLNLEGLDFLTSQGFDGIEAIKPGGDLVIVTSINTIKGAVSSPWVIFHGIFDSFDDDYVSQLDVLDLDLKTNVEDIEMSGIDNEVLMSCMTMGAAQRGELNGQTTDIVAEMMCQEILDKRGVYFNFDNLDDPETQMMIKEFGAQVKKEAKTFRQNARGKLIFVNA